MNLRFDENTDATDAVELDFSVFIFVPVTHPVQGFAVHIVFFVAYVESSIKSKNCDNIPEEGQVSTFS